MPKPPSRGGVSSPYGMRINPNDGRYRMHYGEDTLGVGNYAPVNGTVVFAGFDHTGTGLGYAVGIRETASPTVIWWVAHHASLNVGVGSRTVEGVTFLGEKGESGAAKGVHCHTERRVGGAARPGSGTATNPRAYYTSTAGGGAIPFDNAPEEDDMPTYVWTDQDGVGYALIDSNYVDGLILTADPTVATQFSWVAGRDAAGAAPVKMTRAAFNAKCAAAVALWRAHANRGPAVTVDAEQVAEAVLEKLGPTIATDADLETMKADLLASLTHLPSEVVNEQAKRLANAGNP